MSLPTDPKSRKNIPLYSGLLKYFPDALCAVAEVSRVGNEQHHPGQPLHWDRAKSMDQHDCIVRHLMEAGTVDTDGLRHTAKLAWRALAALQLEIEAQNERSPALELLSAHPDPGPVVPVVTQIPHIPPPPEQDE